jgi:hypothetical protein
MLAVTLKNNPVKIASFGLDISLQKCGFFAGI